MIPVKVCGITSVEDAILAAEAGASAIGLIFFDPSPRCVDVEKGVAIVAALPSGVAKVGVFVNEDLHHILETVKRVGLDFIQLHGNEDPNYCLQLNRPIIKTVKIGGGNPVPKTTDYLVHAWLLDTASRSAQGGTGIPFDWASVNLSRFKKPVILAGGLTSHNVLEGIRVLQPDALDISSGLEARPGKKDPDKLSDFFQVLRDTGPYKNIFQSLDTVNHEK